MTTVLETRKSPHKNEVHRKTVPARGAESKLGIEIPNFFVEQVGHTLPALFLLSILFVFFEICLSLGLLSALYKYPLSILAVVFRFYCALGPLLVLNQLNRHFNQVWPLVKLFCTALHCRLAESLI